MVISALTPNNDSYFWTPDIALAGNWYYVLALCQLNEPNGVHKE